MRGERVRRRWLVTGGSLALLAIGIGLLALGLGARQVRAQGTGVTIVDFAFQPASLQVAVGSTVTWTNGGQAPHTATGSGFNSGTLAPGASFSQTFGTAGTFSYICSIHPNMQGSITVVAAAASAPAVSAPAASAPAASARPSAAPSLPNTGTGPATGGAADRPAVVIAALAGMVLLLGSAAGVRAVRRSRPV